MVNFYIFKRTVTSLLLVLLSIFVLASCDNATQSKPEEQAKSEKPTNNSVYFFHDFVAIEKSYDNLNPNYVKQVNETIDAIPYDISVTNNVLELNYYIKNKSDQNIKSIFIDALIYLHNPEFGDNSEFILLVPLNYDLRANLTIDGQESTLLPGEDFNFKVKLPLSRLNLIPGTPNSIRNFLDNGKYKFIAVRTITKIVRFNDGSFIDTSAKDPEPEITLDPALEGQVDNNLPLEGTTPSQQQEQPATESTSPTEAPSTPTPSTPPSSTPTP